MYHSDNAAEGRLALKYFYPKKKKEKGTVKAQLWQIVFLFFNF